jgi:hypothetical protein
MDTDAVVVPAAGRDEPVGCHWYRSRGQRVLIMLAGYCGTAYVAILGLALIGVPSAGPGAAALLLMAVLGFIGTHRSARAGARVDAHGVTIVNPRRSVTIQWSMLERFSVRPKGLWPRVGIAHLRDGSRVTIWGIQGPNPRTRPENRSAEKLIDALNARLGSMQPSE